MTIAYVLSETTVFLIVYCKMFTEFFLLLDSGRSGRDKGLVSFYLSVDSGLPKAIRKISLK